MLGEKAEPGMIARLAIVLLAASLSPALAEPGWTLADTYPDTGGRAPVAQGGKVLPPGSSPLSVLAGCSERH